MINCVQHSLEMEIDGEIYNVEFTAHYEDFDPESLPSCIEIDSYSYINEDGKIIEVNVENSPKTGSLVWEMASHIDNLIEETDLSWELKEKRAWSPEDLT